ncbi:hypothetical protein [Sphingobacterium faecale]|uniref:Lasso RiPP family leader peptide-containing protein n=1 Tax=Sphingobacterium faecale TaxID=2803775 RepID=A0ABS1R9S6_9SPHI|nr:hypothetical protein [Sphingobacterium faecale]MBL1411471.1 hypothetical protein [Sphingobacterium faecale]
MKKTYKTPTIEVIKVQLEESIAAASIVTGGATSMPEIEEEILIEDTQKWTIDLD